MGSEHSQGSLNKDSTTEVYDKTSNILRAIEQCGCIHCLSILKKGLEQPLPNTNTDDTVTNQNHPIRHV